MTPIAGRGAWTPEWSRWPLTAYLELPALSSAPYRGRVHVRDRLSQWGLRRLADSAELLVSELLTNAMHAPAAHSWFGASTPIAVRTSSDHHRLVIEVSDADPTPPRPGVPDLDAEDGRGYLLIAGLADQWGSYRTTRTSPILTGRRRWPDGTGKVVWVLLHPEPRTGKHATGT